MRILNKRYLAALLLATFGLTAMAQQMLTGTVKDQNGEPLIGVSVSVGGRPVAITDYDGRFSLPQTQPSEKIEFSYIGYQTQTVTPGSRTQIDVVMTDDAHSLNELVVVGYGTMKKSDLTGEIGRAHV